MIKNIINNLGKLKSPNNKPEKLKTASYTDLSSGEKKKILRESAKDSVLEQQKMCEKYAKKYGSLPALSI